MTQRANAGYAVWKASWGSANRGPILRAIGAEGLVAWKNDSGYHRRNLAESIMYRLKQLADSLYSQTFERQVTEAYVRAPSSSPSPTSATYIPRG